MTIRSVNLLQCELDERLDEFGFHHAATPIANRLGAQRIGAGVYEAIADHPIWPYHYHYSSEEWLYVISGTPVLRDAGGRRALRGGDLVCFPPDHRGAHTMLGPGRFIIFSSNESPGPWVSVYPDSDKISVSPGRHEPTDLNALLLSRSGHLDYWHGEGSADPPSPRSVEREPGRTPSLPVANALTVPVTDRDRTCEGPRPRTAVLGESSGGLGLAATVVELDPGLASAPYHYVHGREEWVLILSGSAVLRRPGGEAVLQAGDVTCFPEGPAGAHRLINRGSETARALFLSTMGWPANVCYPDSGTWILRNGPGEPEVTVHETDPA